MLEILTEEQELTLERVAQEWMDCLDSCRQPDISNPKILAGLRLIYSLFDKPLPAQIELAKNRVAALARSKELGEPNPHLDRIGAWNCGWTARNNAHHQIGVVTDEEAADLLTYSELYLSGVYDTVLLDDCAIVVPFPLTLCRDDAGELHSAIGPAITWEGDEQYWWHGVATEEKFILGDWSKDELLALANTEQRRILQERLGAQFYELMEATVIDTWTDPETALAYALLRYMDGETEARALRKLSPKLQGGQQPTYVERVNVLCATAQSARKWQATRHLHDASDFCAEACNKDPSLSYGIEA